MNGKVSTLVRALCQSGLLLAVLVSSHAACAPPDEAASSEIQCASTANCPLHQVCRLGPRECSVFLGDDDPCALGAGTCEPEPADRVTGAFRCQVVAEGDPTPEAATSFLIANVGDRRIRLTAAVSCFIVDDPDLGPIVQLSFYSGRRGEGRLLTDVAVDGGIGTLTRVVSLGRPSTAFPLNGGVIYGDDAEGKLALDKLFAVTGDGTIVLDTIPRRGGFLAGYVDAALVAGRDSAHFGGACPGGFPDCGDGRLSCQEYAVRGVTHQRCVRSVKCTSDADCTEFTGGACLGDHCVKTCLTSAECEAPLTCALIETGRPRACY